MRTRATGNVIDATTEPLGGAVMDSNIPIVAVVSGSAGTGSFSVASDDESDVRLYPAGKRFRITGSTGNDTAPGTAYTISADGTHNSITNEIEILVNEIVPNAVADGFISGFGINMGGDNVTTDNRITNSLDPTDAQDAATKNYVDNVILALVLPILNSLVVSGSIVGWTSDTIPTGWYKCDGSAKTVAGDTPLHNAIGYDFGGAGVTFNLPDLRGRFPLGLNSIPIVASDRIDRVEAQTLGTVAGVETVQVGTAEMPQHSHTGTALENVPHSHSGTASNAGAHRHDILVDFTSVDTSSDANDDPILLDLILNGRPLTSNRMNNDGNHSHNLNNMADSIKHKHNLSIVSKGGNAAHENTSPYQVVNYIIKR